MRLRNLVALAGLAFLLAGCGGAGTTTTVTFTKTVTISTAPANPSDALAETSDVKYFGVPVAMTKLDSKRYLITLEPEHFLVGMTANVSFAGSRGDDCQPLECAPVENDHWVIPAGTENLWFILPASTTGTLLANGLSTGTKATAAELFDRVNSGSTPSGGEPLESGLWLTVNVDTVTRFAQQFQP